jgi:CubicO group peptidase (beta-lactamase class C family)
LAAAATNELQSLLEELTRKHKVPGAALAVLDGDEVSEVATGVINKNTGVETTTDTVFQIGSITKVFTTMLVMQFVDEGKIELDKPVRDYLPELKFADPEATESITVRQLLCHTSGVDGDHFEDTGRGDDCVKEYVASCAILPQTSAPGTLFSYCNAGFVVAGRLVEQLSGQTWDVALKERLLGPLGTQRTVTLPEEAILHRAALGHIDPTNSGELTPAPVWVLPRSAGPAGLIVSTASELLSFARLHIDDGVAPDGTSVLSKDSVRAMQEQQVDLPDRWTQGRAWGLGWILFGWDGQNVIGHDGGTIGQLAFLRIVPDRRFAVALLTNGMTGRNLYKDLYARLFSERVGIEVPDTPKPADGVEFEASLYAGVYERLNVRTEVEVQDGGLVASIEFGGPMKEMLPPIQREPLKPINETSFLIHMPVVEEDMPFVFFDFDDSGRPRYFHSGGRASPRVN